MKFPSIGRYAPTFPRPWENIASPRQMAQNIQKIALPMIVLASLAACTQAEALPPCPLACSAIFPSGQSISKTLCDLICVGFFNIR